MTKFSDAIYAWFNPNPDYDVRATEEDTPVGSPRYIETRKGYLQRKDWVPPHRTLPENFKVNYYERYQSGADYPYEMGFEPGLSELGEDITDWDRLIWQAACLYEETGIDVQVYEGFGATNGYRDEEYIYALSGPGWGMTGRSFEDCWTYMNGIRSGYRLIEEGKSHLTIKEQDDTTYSSALPNPEEDANTGPRD